MELNKKNVIEMMSDEINAKTAEQTPDKLDIVISMLQELTKLMGGGADADPEPQEIDGDSQAEITEQE